MFDSHTQLLCDSSQEEGVAELAGAVEGLRLENKALKDRVDTHEQERLSVEESSRKNKDQLHDMAQTVSSRGRQAGIGCWVSTFCSLVSEDIILMFVCPYFTQKVFQLLSSLKFSESRKLDAVKSLRIKVCTERNYSTDWHALG